MSDYRVQLDVCFIGGRDEDILPASDPWLMFDNGVRVTNLDSVDERATRGRSAHRDRGLTSA